MVIFFARAVITGLLLGAIGYFLIEVYLKNRLVRLPLGKQLFIVALVAFLAILAMMSPIVNSVAEISGIPVLLMLIIMIFGNVMALFTISFFIFLLILTRGMPMFVDFSYKVLGPIIGGGLGFALVIFNVEEGEKISAALLFILGFVSGGISGFVAYATRSLISRFAS